jgi:hypothetical protein
MLRYNSMSIKVDWNPVFDHVIEFGSVVPFYIGYDSTTLRRLHVQDARIVLLRDEMRAALEMYGAISLQEHTWTDHSSITQWHRDNNGKTYDVAGKQTIIALMSISDKSATSQTGTVFRNSLGEEFHAKLWHIYLLDYKVEHRGSKNCGPKTLIRYYCQFPFEL